MSTQVKHTKNKISLKKKKKTVSTESRLGLTTMQTRVQNPRTYMKSQAWWPESVILALGIINTRTPEYLLVIPSNSVYPIGRLWAQ